LYSVLSKGWELETFLVALMVDPIFGVKKASSSHPFDRHVVLDMIFGIGRNCTCFLIPILAYFQEKNFGPYLAVFENSK